MTAPSIFGALLWMADKLKSDQGEQARALWAAKGKQAFAVERATDGTTISQETLQDRVMTDGGRRERIQISQHGSPSRGLAPVNRRWVPM